MTLEYKTVDIPGKPNKHLSLNYGYFFANPPEQSLIKRFSVTAERKHALTE